MSNPPDVPVYKRRDILEPVAELGQLAARTPVYRNTGSEVYDWIAVGRDEVRAILGDTERFSTRPPQENPDLPRPRPEPGNLLMYDLPEHTKLRQKLTPDFTVRRMRALEPAIERIVTGQLDVLEKAGRPADLMKHFARPVSGLVGCAVLGIPRDDLPQLARMTDIRAARRSPKRTAARKAFNAYMDRIVAQKRRDPGEDLLSTLIQRHGSGLTDQELAGICSSVIAGELENASEMLGLGALALLVHPDQFGRLRERPELMENAVEELLRYVSVVSVASPRTALEDVTIGGQVIKEGEVVGCSLFAAHRATAPGEPPDTLDITREPGSHMALGHGIHFCLGAALARMQLRIAYRGLLDRFPGLRLAVPPEELRFRLLAPQHGIETLPVEW
ncbi:cytochrome P450 [Streptomyces fumanus]|uniref:Cytochrome P450 n=1 Tax=Streptomyces fumanus TaxID=67302 RepID=A0A919AHU5_9ACTN|nr:cytochrome P450 [Streptomyces fumanus]GHF07620.1 cytochrome P450 [Streptomyces fumanus]